MNVERVLERLEQVKRTGTGWIARCPAHADNHASLSVTEGGDGRVLIYCHAGCPLERVVEALGLVIAELFPEGGGVRHRRHEPSTAQRCGCTLANYAQAKGLPLELLKGFGLTEMTYLGAPAVRIPYVDSEGAEIAVRFRIGLTGDDRFRWRKGSKPCLYGLQRLEQARETGYVVLVEGESCTQTLWAAGYPALGLPGANQWHEDRDSGSLDGIETVYVVIEPDQGGATMLTRLGNSSLHERVRLVRLEGTKDVSELYLRSPNEFVERFEAALQAAIPWEQHQRVEAELQRQAAWETCAPLARDPRILDRLAEDAARLGLVGEERLAKLVYLILTSRYLPKIVSCSLKGASSVGKSFLLETVLRFIPEQAYFAYTGMSEKALIFGEEDMRHKFVVIYEATGLEDGYLAYLVRSLLSEGEIRYQITERGTDGRHQTRTVEREGPTGLIVTTTAVKLHEENETRFLSLPADDRPEQTKRILYALATSASARCDPPVNFERWHAFNEWLAHSENRVLVPFAPALAELIPPAAVRLRRDFGAILALIQAHALLHQASREHDADGLIIATLTDYANVHALVRDLIADGVEATVPPPIRELVTVVQTLTALNSDGVSIRAISEELKLDKASASRRWQVARDRGYLKNLETTKGRSARIVCAEALPDEIEILPRPETLSHRCGVDADPAESPAPSLPSRPFAQDADKISLGEHVSLPEPDQAPLDDFIRLLDARDRPPA